LFESKDKNKLEVTAMTQSENKEAKDSWKHRLHADKLGELHPRKVREKVPWWEVRKNLLLQLGVAFGTIIGFIWTQVVIQGFNAFGFPLAAGYATPLSWILFIIAAIAVTLIAVFGMVLISRWQAKDSEK